MTTTATKSPSAELAKLKRKRETTYAALQKVKRQRDAWEDDLRSELAALTAYVTSHPEDWRDEARNPKPGTESETKRDAFREKQAAGNPHEPDYVEAREKFHAADDALATFMRHNLPELIAEDEPAFAAVLDKYREAFALMVEAGTEYEALIARTDALVKATPGIDGQAVTFDRRPSEWRTMAARALDDPLARPGLTELGLWKLGDR